MITLLCRFIDWFLSKKKISDPEYDTDFLLARIIIGANFTAVMWSVYALYAVQHSDFIEKTVIIIAIAGMSSGAATVFSAHKKTALCYALLLPIPVSVMLMLDPLHANNILGLLAFTFSIVMALIASKSASFTKNAIALKNENAGLLNDMEREVEQRTHKIYELSNLDPLTKLYNRTAFIETLGHCLKDAEQHNKQLALLFIDLDGFKKVNDTFGHEVGDIILSESAQRLKASVSDQHLLCRWGGDEFLIALEDFAQEKVVARANEFIKVLSYEHKIGDGTIISVGATIGVSFFPEHETVQNRLIQFADTAMYHQKKFHSGRVCVFTPEMAAKQRYELKLKNGLNEAIEREQLRMVFQPIVSSGKADIIAFEALLRWQFDDENIPPDEFIDIAEQYGLINRIGAWVLNESCRIAASWQSLKDNVAVCINVSVIQLQDPDFLNILEDAIQGSGIKPSLICLEITESVFANDTEHMLEKLALIQKMGINISMDDFGTGYSSLSAMQDLAVDTVKIDRSFINKLEDSGNAIVTAVMHISSSLGFDVVAEGVETEDQWKKLKALGVHKLQGYFFSKPIEAKDVKSLIELKNECH